MVLDGSTLLLPTCIPFKLKTMFLFHHIQRYFCRLNLISTDLRVLNFRYNSFCIHNSYLILSLFTRASASSILAWKWFVYSTSQPSYRRKRKTVMTKALVFFRTFTSRFHHLNRTSTASVDNGGATHAAWQTVINRLFTHHEHDCRIQAIFVQDVKDRLQNRPLWAAE